ncbi:Na/Pi cotransporter family protein [Anaerolineales bacterium HSG24]|nr:Na/Pi cotransporter family protein [Anaerolineales bacterium HSG24]
MNSSHTIEWSMILINLLGGLAVFLFGMEQMTSALQRVAGKGMKKLLATLTTNRFTGVIAGAISTAIVQSSSVTTVLIIGFVSAGVMTLQQSIPLIMGAEIGTTITAQMLAFKVTKYAMVFIAIGFAMHFTSKNDTIKEYGLMLLGFGLIFFGLTLMSGATKPLRSYPPFLELMQSLENPLLGILVGVMFTSIVQSSSATTGVIVALASQGLITLEAGIALAFGANVGTCVTALLASIGKPREAVRTALVHLTFNISGVIFWFIFLDQLAFMIRWISPSYPELVGVELLAAETPRQIANAHTMFNTLNVLFFVWFTSPLAKFVTYLVPDKLVTKEESVHAQYLDGLLLETPNLALEQTCLELGRLGEHASKMVEVGLPIVLKGDKDKIDSIAQMDKDVDRLHQEIFNYLGQLSRQNLSTSQAQQLSNYMIVTNYIENIGNRVNAISPVGHERLQYGIKIDKSTEELLNQLQDKILWSVENAVLSLVNSDRITANRVLATQTEVKQLVRQGEDKLFDHPASRDPSLVALFRAEFEILEYLERVYYFAERIASVVTKEESKQSHPVSNDRVIPPASRLKEPVIA